jgi:Flp pilus assembly pilin Flp
VSHLIASPTAHDVAPLPAGAVVPTASSPPVLQAVPGGATDTAVHDAPRPELALVSDEEGSLVAEYGLLAVVAATVAGVLIAWSRTGALDSFFGALLDHARSIVIG